MLDCTRQATEISFAQKVHVWVEGSVTLVASSHYCAQLFLSNCVFVSAAFSFLCLCSSVCVFSVFSTVVVEFAFSTFGMIDLVGLFVFYLLSFFFVRSFCRLFSQPQKT